LSKKVSFFTGGAGCPVPGSCARKGIIQNNKAQNQNIFVAFKDIN
jgi:hypothetical protein